MAKKLIQPIHMPRLAPKLSALTDKLVIVPLPSLKVILLIAAALRIGSILIVRSYAHPATWEFGPLASSLAAGLGYSELLDNGLRVPAIYMPPAYSYFLALFYRIGGETAVTYLTIEILQASAGLLLVYLVYRLASLLVGHRAGLGAATLAAVYPTQVYMCNEFHGINIYIVLGVAAVFFLSRYLISNPRWPDLIAAALCMGLLMLFRAEAVALVSVYALIIIAVGRRKALFPAMLLVAIAYGCLVPWMVRNYQTFHRIIPICASGGWNLFIGNNPRATGSQHYKAFDPMPVDVQRAFDAITPDRYERIQRDHALGEIAIKYIRTHPFDEVKLALRKLWIFFTFDPAHDKGRNPIYWVPSVILTILTGAGALRRGRELFARDFLVVVSIFFTVAVSTAIFVLPRYKIMIDPFFMIVAGSLLVGKITRQPQVASLETVDERISA